MAFRIAARVIFDASKAITGVGRFRKEVLVAGKDVQFLKTQAKENNVSVSKMLRVMQQKRGLTKFQRDVKTASSAVRTVTSAAKEARLWVRLFRGSANRGVKVRGLARAKRDFKSLTLNIRGAGGALAGFLGGIAGGLTVFGGARVLGGFTDMVGQSIQFSNNMETAKITFDTMLGSQAKSTELLDKLNKFSAQTPFLRSDVIEGSKTLLAVTKDNVDANERLVKKAAELSALTGGRRKVADAALGIRQATFGEFEILKGFGVVLRQAQFEGAGEKGGEEYGKAVIKEIERQLKEKTGGRDLVKALSETFTGKLSTFRDNVEQSMETIGTAIKDGLDLKGVVQTGIDVMSQFRIAMVSLVTGKPEEGLETVNESILNMAIFIRDGISRVKTLKSVVVSALKPIVDTWQLLTMEQQRVIFFGSLMFASIVSGVGVVGPVLAILVGGVLALGATLSPLSGAVLPALKIGLLAVAFVLLPLTLAIGALTSMFLLFRRRNEGVMDTIRRFGSVMKTGFLFVWDRARAFMAPIIREVLPALGVSLGIILDNIAELREPLAEFFSLFGGQSISDIKDWTRTGQAMADLLVDGIKKGTELATTGTRRLTNLIKATRPIWRDTVSDILQVGRAFFTLISDVSMTKASLKTIFLGLTDILTSPLRIMLANSLNVVEDGLIEIAEFAGKINKRLETKIRGIAAGIPEAQRSILEGVLATDLKIEIEAPEIPIRVEVPIDGETVAEATTVAQMRARNSGRGGDPLNPEEMGFVINKDNNIRSVDLNEVAGDF